MAKFDETPTYVKANCKFIDETTHGWEFDILGQDLSKTFQKFPKSLCKYTKGETTVLIKLWKFKERDLVYTPEQIIHL